GTTATTIDSAPWSPRCPCSPAWASAERSEAMPRTLRWLVALSFFGLACDQDALPQAWQLDGFRVLGVTLEPPDARPGQTVRATLVYADPGGTGRDPTTLWLPCTGD